LFVENLKELGDAVKLRTSNVVTGLEKKNRYIFSTGYMDKFYFSGLDKKKIPTNSIY